MKTVGISVKALDAREKSQPGCKAALLAAGTVNGDLLNVPEAAYAAIQAKHPPLPHLARRVIKSKRPGKRPLRGTEKRLKRLWILLPLAWLMKRLGVKRPGDAFERMARPVARIVRMNCHDSATGKLRPNSPCGKAKPAMNSV